MQTVISRRLPSHDAGVSARPLAYEDPIGMDDIAADAPIVTTARGLCRIAVIAAQVATRFESEDSKHDPMDWMLAPRRLFAGSNALSACLERDAFMRAMLLHGLALGMDAEIDELDDLICSDDLDAERDFDFMADTGAGGRGRSASDGQPRLHTALVAYRGDGVMLHAFHASVAGSVEEIADRLAYRYGPAVAARATIIVGFDASTPFARAMVAPAMAELLANVGADPTSRVAAGLDLNLEQRLEA